MYVVVRGLRSAVGSACGTPIFPVFRLLPKSGAESELVGASEVSNDENEELGTLNRTRQRYRTIIHPFLPKTLIQLLSFTIFVSSRTDHLVFLSSTLPNMRTTALW
jgi:hypothetical protein